MEYWAEAVQSWFDTNREPDHDHNHVNTRDISGPEGVKFDLVVLHDLDILTCEERDNLGVIAYDNPGMRPSRSD